MFCLLTQLGMFLHAECHGIECQNKTKHTDTLSEKILNIWVAASLISHIHTIFTGRNEVVAKVMFLQVCVCPQGGRGCLPQCMLGCQPPPPNQAPPRPGRPPGPGSPPPPRSRLQHTVYEWPVRILLECILVILCVF